jgi:hypothetical protein
MKEALGTKLRTRAAKKGKGLGKRGWLRRSAAAAWHHSARGICSCSAASPLTRGAAAATCVLPRTLTSHCKLLKARALSLPKIGEMAIMIEQGRR